MGRMKEKSERYKRKLIDWVTGRALCIMDGNKDMMITIRVFGLVTRLAISAKDDKEVNIEFGGLFYPLNAGLVTIEMLSIAYDALEDKIIPCEVCGQYDKGTYVHKMPDALHRLLYGY